MHEKPDRFSWEEESGISVNAPRPHPYHEPLIEKNAYVSK
jgi:hypothetical protein